MARKDVLAVVLGGGQGVRLYPLTKMRAKPAVPIGGKYRLIDIPISNCINSGITRVFVLTQFLSASLHRHVYRTYQFDVFSEGFVEILAAEQTLAGTGWYQGTADAVRRQMSRILSRDPEHVLILAGDHLYRMDYSLFIDHHCQQQADVTVPVLPVASEAARQLGILKTDETGRITTFQEKPQSESELKALESHLGQENPFLASMGIYLFKTEALAELLELHSEPDFGRHIVPAAIEAKKVCAYPFDGYWEDIGTISAFYEANLALTQPNPQFDFYDPQNPIYTRHRFLPSSRVDGCQLNQVMVAEGCWLYDAKLDECVIGLRSIIRPGVRLRRVVMMGADFFETDAEKRESRRKGVPPVGIDTGTVIERAIIDKNARIGRNVVIRSQEGSEDRDEEHYSIRDGIVVIHKNAVIRDRTII